MSRLYKGGALVEQDALLSALLKRKIEVVEVVAVIDMRRRRRIILFLWVLSVVLAGLLGWYSKP